MVELPVYEVNPIQLLIAASFFVIILLAVIFDRHLEEKRNKDAIDKIDEGIEID